MKLDHSQHENKCTPFWGSRYSIGLIVFGGIALYFLLTEHRAHFFGALPLLLLLSCPLMHAFMHHGHHHVDRNNSSTADESAASDKKEQP